MAESQIMRLLDAVTATGDGPVEQLVFPRLAVAVQMETTGAPTQVKVTVKGLIAGSTYGTLCVLDTLGGYTAGEIVMLPIPVLATTIKASLDTLSGGSNPTVSLYCAVRR